jgi:hypothetical protein
MNDEPIRIHPWDGGGPSLWDVVLLVGAGFILGVAVCIVFGLLVVVV